MKPDQMQNGFSANAPFASIAPADYAKLAIARIRANGGDGVVLSENGQPAQWRAWMAYFAHLDGLTSPRGRKAVIYGSLKTITVPTAWPLEFDLDAPPAPPPEPQAPPVSVARRKELAGMLRRLVAHVTLEQKRAPSWRNVTPATAETRLAELKDKFARGPPMDSTPDFAAYLASMRNECWL